MSSSGITAGVWIVDVDEGVEWPGYEFNGFVGCFQIL